MGQTVNLLAHAYGGSNPSLPTSEDAEFSCKPSEESSLFSEAQPRNPQKSQIFAEVAQLVEHQPSKLRVAGSNLVFRSNIGQSSSGVERFLGKEEVVSSILTSGSNFYIKQDQLWQKKPLKETNRM